MKYEWTYPIWIFAAFGSGILLMAFAHFYEAHLRKTIRYFSNSNLSYSEPSRLARFYKWLFFSTAIGLTCVCLAEPRHGIELSDVSYKGRDIVFILDVSKSMLATDITPTRLKRAKADIIDGIKKINGHRIGLIAFAGQPKEISPLTWDYSHLIRRIKTVTPDSVRKGGTNILDALNKALDLIEAGAKLGNYKDLVLITDGQDLMGYYEQAAKRAGKLGVSIYTIGIGQAEKTSIKKADGTYLKSKGKVVETALDSEPLKLISQLSADGFYQNLAVQHNWLDNIIDVIDAKESNKTKSEKQSRKIPRYYIFLIFALIFLFLAVIIPDRRSVS
jgi:Ca-activated chloride channel homolog